ncbi:molybdopterin molybdotransferase MoeA [Lacimicrobium sp. SS2-24]|uniref:molybdopterin molybdotransferase MoeA n=1 Tax=Lacimicrobium sp. SS2-24 TaxID=2005569 RepID=UPI000B4AB6C0|nr:molybdopterin molybdotransferase MoeA [Lacimicrobium sp. SS2-24]
MTDCFSKDLLGVEQAMDYMLSALSPVTTESQNITLEQACGRILSEPVRSDLAIPPFDNSAMDGYALRAADLKQNKTLRLIGRSFAGEPFEGSIEAGHTIRIMTGAVIPKGADAVVMQENCQAEAQNITFNSAVKAGDNIRRCGEDIQSGDIVLPQGHKISPVDIGLLASLGVAEVSVYRPLRIALFSSGDELVLPGNPLKPGQIYDSNRAALRAMLEKMDVEVIDLGLIADDKHSLREAMLQGAQTADGIISSGGVSVGEADYTKEVLEQLGKVNFWKLAIKPGKPFAFGKIEDCPFFGLPGNPVSALVTFHQLVLPALAVLSGRMPQQALRITAISSEKLKKRPGRMDLQRGFCWQDENGSLMVRSSGKQGSSLLTSISKANCFICLPRDSGDVEAGANVQIQLFDGLLSSKS